MDERLRAGPHVFVADLARIELDDVDTHHLVKVLRLRDGRPLTVSDGRGSWLPARWTGGAVEPDGEVVSEPPPDTEVAVAAPPVKGDRTEWMVAKLTELGVDEIILVDARRSVVHWEGERAERHLARLDRIARESSMQSRRLRLPRIVGPAPVAELLAEVGERRLAVAEVGAPVWGGEAAGGDAVEGEPRADSAGAVAGVVVGPEGGWEPDEIAGVQHLVGLPGGVLRTETAAVVAGTLLMNQRALSARILHRW